jgi:predicted Rdx family selenoprotein
VGCWNETFFPIEFSGNLIWERKKTIAGNPKIKKITEKP